MERLKVFNDDCHPDAHACRVKLSLSTRDTPMVCPWDLETEVQLYQQKLDSISAACRLSASEEHFLLTVLLPFKHFNRQEYLNAMLNSRDEAPLTYPQPPAIENEWDLVSDQSCLAPPSDSFLSGFTYVSYKRPSVLIGSPAIKSLNGWIQRGLKLQGGKDDLGFMFLYELLTGTLNIKILTEDSPYYLGNLLARLLPTEDFMRPSNTMSAIRVLCRNAIIAGDPSIPKVKVVEKVCTVESVASLLSIPVLFKGMDNMYSRLLKELQPWMLNRKDSIDCAGASLSTFPTRQATRKVNFERLPRHFFTPVVKDLCRSECLYAPRPCSRPHLRKT